MKVAIGISGASGSIYAALLLKKLNTLLKENDSVGIVLSSNASTVWKHELGSDIPAYTKFKVYEKNDFFAPFASGSAGYDAFVIIPCSMGIIGRIASGISDDLITRTADVMLKERRKLILVPREAPYNLIQLKNMVAITEAGGIICPASPSFYSLPADIEALAQTIVDRVIDLIGMEQSTHRWSS